MSTHVPSGKPRIIRSATGYRLLALCGVVLLIALLLHGSSGRAARAPLYITLGESLPESQRTEILTLFGYDATIDPQPNIVTIQETKNALTGVFPTDGIDNATSSTSLSCRELGSGLDVTTVNINLITPDIYAMTLVTAGIGDANLTVAAPSGIGGATGKTALTGVFKTWNLSPCAGGEADPVRQRLAMRQLELTVRLSASLGRIDGLTVATSIMLETQKAIVTQGLSTSAQIEAEVRRQEALSVVVMPDDLRTEVVSFYVDLVAADIDWSTFSAGWEIQRPDKYRITMTGDGIAIRNAQMTATARAALTQTASARLSITPTPSPTSTPSPTPTRTPTATPSPKPTATPTPVAQVVTGTIDHSGDGQISVRLDGSSLTPVTYQVDPAVNVTRGGIGGTMEAVQKGDRVQLTIDGSTGLVTAAVFDPVPVESRFPLQAALMALIGVLLLFVLVRRIRVEPFILQNA